jgi:hypothetical protein
MELQYLSTVQILSSHITVQQRIKNAVQQSPSCSAALNSLALEN